MAKRGYKLQEFMAHSANVNCVKIGRKTCRLFMTGGDDEKVNLWSIGKPNPVTSLRGHTSPVESVAFDTAEALVAAGCSAGVIKLWDLEETKMVRSLTGHRSYCTAIEFHPFGEFFASGSMDTNLKIWDIRKKGCIHTYKGHTRGIGTIRFTPDGRWVVSGGLDNAVKVWDLTAGKLLHDFKSHEGHIRSIDFHPLEFLLATGSADRTVKFWDLETFELIGSARPEATGVRSITFHPDGRTLFCGLDSSLKVYSWEPVICHDAVDMGWSTLGDLCIHDGKLLGCSYYQNSVGVWVADISLIEPYGESLLAEQKSQSEQKTDLQQSQTERVGSHRRSTRLSPDYDSKEIKNIYVDSGIPMTSQKAGSSPKVENLPDPDPREYSNLAAQKQVPAASLHAKNFGQANGKSFTVPSVVSGETLEVKDLAQKQVPAATLHAKRFGQGNNKSFVVPNIVPRETPDVKELAKSRRESLASGRGSTGMSLKPTQIRRSSSTKLDLERLSVNVESLSIENMKSGLDSTSPNLQRRPLGDDTAKDSSEDEISIIKSVEEKFEKVSSPRKVNLENCDESLYSSKGSKSVKYVNGVAVVRGRTLSLVERFERRETLTTNECQMPDTAQLVPDTADHLVHDTAAHLVPDNAERSAIMVGHMPDTVPHVVPEGKASPVPAVRTPDTVSNVIPEKAKTSPMLVVQTPDAAPRTLSQKAKISPMLVVQTPDAAPRTLPPKAKTSPMPVVRTPDAAPHTLPEKAKSSPMLDDSPQTTGRGFTSGNDAKFTEELMESHDLVLSTLRSRLTKLQVMRHFWERNDMKGAINALRKLPDHSVQADVVGVLMEKTETLTLELFSCLLPVLMGLLDSKTERHTNISLEMLLKLVAVFGPVVHSTISAPPSVGVDLHAEKRLEWCNQCFMQLEKIQKTLPTIIRRGGLQARGAHELNLILQAS